MGDGGGRELVKRTVTPRALMALRCKRTELTSSRGLNGEKDEDEEEDEEEVEEGLKQEPRMGEMTLCKQSMASSPT